jgi:uncharacterized LabA/DUF88 family protein
LKTTAILIDFDNYFGSNTIRINSESLEYSFSELVNIAESLFKDIEYIEIRLYGGWFYETSLTKQASIIQQLLPDVRVFPKVKKGKIIHGSINLVSTLYEIPDFVWHYSYKETNGIKRVRINYDTIDTKCNENRNSCPKFILHKFTEGKDRKCAVNGCENIQKNVFKGIEQKMVDTLIACDVLSFSEDVNLNGLILVSDDQDLLPSLALAVRKTIGKVAPQSFTLAIRNEQKYDFIRNYLRPFRIQTVLIT